MPNDVKETIHSGREEFKKFMRPGFGGLYAAIGVAVVTGVIAYAVRNGGRPIICLIIGLGIAVLIAGAWLAVRRDYNRFMREHAEKGDLDGIIEDFSKGEKWFQGKVCTGENQMYLRASSENVLAYTDVLNLHEYVHRTNGAEDRRSLRAVISGRKTVDICSLALRGRANEEMLRFFALMMTKNPKMTLGYEEAKKLI